MYSALSLTLSRVIEGFGALELITKYRILEQKGHKETDTLFTSRQEVFVQNCLIKKTIYLDMSLINTGFTESDVNEPMPLRWTTPSCAGFSHLHSPKHGQFM